MILATAMMCLALNIYHEARGETLAGQQAVALVTMNRADWQPKRVCREVYKPAQFSWTTEAHGKPTDRAAWLQAKQVAMDALTGRLVDFTGGADHYHTKQVKPRWNWKKLKYVMTLGAHRFYRLA
jgi:spore germination cell wall hydrolase CwlJ-like protein